jgi:hypothetical protein
MMAAMVICLVSHWSIRCWEYPTLRCSEPEEFPQYRYAQQAYGHLPDAQVACGLISKAALCDRLA